MAIDLVVMVVEKITGTGLDQIGKRLLTGNGQPGHPGNQSKVASAPAPEHVARAAIPLTIPAAATVNDGLRRYAAAG